jgi:hypothetical protein
MGKHIAWAAVVAAAVAGPLSIAHGQVATIYGFYDPEAGINSLPASVLTNPNNPNHYGDSGDYDTPALFFVNPSAFAITGAQMLLSVNPTVNNGQNTYNNGISQTVSLGTIGANGITEVAWLSGGGSGTLFVYDYDDSYPSNYGAGVAGNSGSFGADCTLNAPGQDPEWTNFCAPVGNFMVTFTGFLQDGSNGGLGSAVAAVFAEYDVNGVYTGWEGLDPNGWSENLTYDVHSGTVSGVLANIDLGTPETVGGSPLTATPEPATISLLGLGLVGIAGMVKRRNRSPGRDA